MWPSSHGQRKVDNAIPVPLECTVATCIIIIIPMERSEPLHVAIPDHIDELLLSFIVFL
jgi:hypothetical protein